MIDYVQDHTEWLCSDRPTICDSCVLIPSQDYLNIGSELDIFNVLVRWSRKECQRRPLEVNPVNQRMVLGDALYTVGDHYQGARKETETGGGVWRGPERLGLVNRGGSVVWIIDCVVGVSLLTHG